MEISTFPQLTTQVLQRSSNQSVKAWEVGQLLKAKVGVDEQSQQRFIDIGGTRIKADRQLPFATGQLLSIRVEQTGNKLELRILTPPSPLFNPATQLINQAIRAVIAHQSPTNILLPVLAQALNAIDKLPPSSAAIANNNSATTNKVTINPAPNLELELKTAAQRVRDSVPLLSQLRQPQQLKQSSLDSGTFFESKLAISNPPLNANAITKDIKPLLLQLVATIRQALARDTRLSPQLSARLEEKFAAIITKTQTTPSSGRAVEAQTRAEITRLLQLQPLQQLLKTSETLLSRIQLNQLSSLIQSSENNQVWYMEIPYAHNNRHHALQLRINKDASNQKDKEENVWQFEFRFELGDHGSVLSDVRLKEKTINLRFTAETTSGLQLLQNNIHLLNDRLRSLGFEVNARQAQQGEISDLLRPNEAVEKRHKHKTHHPESFLNDE